MNTPPPPLPQPIPNKKKPWWILWVIIGLFVLLFGSCVMAIASVGVKGVNSSASFNISADKIQETVLEQDPGASEKIALIKIEGVITGQNKSYQPSMADIAIKQIKKATKDKSIKGLLLYLNTPGGEVTASDKIYHAVNQFSATGRPVVAYMDTVAASGGYYIACAADEIIATETTITGSIGVIFGGVNAAEMLGKIGIKDQSFKSGAFKDTMSMAREMREDERAYMQSLVDETYDKFAGIVSEARKIPVATLRNGIADGRIFHGVKAKEVGLVDDTGYIAEAITALKKRANLSKAKVIRYRQEPNIGDFLSILGAKAKAENEVKIDWGQGEFTSNLKPFVPYMVLPGY